MGKSPLLVPTLQTEVTGRQIGAIEIGARLAIANGQRRSKFRAGIDLQVWRRFVPPFAARLRAGQGRVCASIWKGLALPDSTLGCADPDWQHDGMGTV